MSVDIDIRYPVNPFIEDMQIKVKGKRITVSSLGDKDNVLINQKTGEVSATHVTAFKKVDEEQFIKLFTKNIAFTFDLTSAGLKTFNIVVWSVQTQGIGKDMIPIDIYALEGFLESYKGKINMSLATMKRGLIDLQKAKIIAKASRQGWYYINPNFIFNGDRIAFTSIIERKSRA